MKIRNLFVAVAASVALYSCGSSEKSATEETTADTSAAVTYTVDAENSTVSWKGTMVKMYSHFGEIKIKEGSLALQGEKLAGGTFVIDLKTINPLDSGYSAERPKEGLVGHLSAPDFFATDSFPTATFVVKSVEGNTATGDLTVRGITNEEKVTDLVVVKDGDNVTASGKVVFNRQKYGVSYKASMKDMVLSDDIEISVELKATK